MFKSLLTIIIILSAVVVIIPSTNLMEIMLMSQFVGGLILPVLLVFMVLIARDPAIMKEYAIGPVSKVLLWATIVIVASLTIALCVFQFL